MQLSVGQNVVHPMHGTGEIIKIKKLDLVEGFNRYYEVEFFDKKLTLNIPVRTVDDSGLRTVMSEEKIDRVFEVLRQEPNQLPDNYKKRRKQIEDLIKTGRPVKFAEVVRDLTWRQEKAGLNTVDNRLLTKARDMLISEIATVTKNSFYEAQEQLDGALAQAVARKEAQVQH